MPGEEPSCIRSVRRTARDRSSFHRAFALSAAVVMVLVGFAVLGQGARASGLGSASPSAGSTYGGTIYRPRIPDSTLGKKQRGGDLSTVRRWDAARRPINPPERSPCPIAHPRKR